MKYFEMTPEERNRFLWWAIPALVLGVLISLLIQKPVIGVIRLNDAINAFTAKDLITQITYAREHPEIRAIVLILDSPGGTVVDTEAVYMELSRLRAEKPVVTWVSGMAASGAYYLSSGTDYVVAVPASEVGNVGVIGYLPPTPFIFEDIISTGPYKLWGSPRDTTVREIEMLKQGFYQAVKLGRGDRLKIGPDVLLRGQIWPGSEALRLGLIDQLGSETDAYNQAAAIAHIWNYSIKDLYNVAIVHPGTTYASGFFLQTKEGVILPYPSRPGLYMLYIPQLPVEQK
ncbi:MAG: S49 family peptidase [Chloroflexi bacterium]|nr:S49 family peptidase [Chloroflexota bacterium]